MKCYGTIRSVKRETNEVAVEKFRHSSNDQWTVPVNLTCWIIRIFNVQNYLFRTFKLIYFKLNELEIKRIKLNDRYIDRNTIENRIWSIWSMIIAITMTYFDRVGKRRFGIVARRWYSNGETSACPIKEIRQWVIYTKQVTG